MTRFDSLWAPLIGHYSGGQLDRARIDAHVGAIRGDVCQYLLGGTTGDGWQLDDALIEAWIDLCTTPAWRGLTVLLAAFGADTGAVIKRAQLLETRIARTPLAARFAGITICAPIKPDATQDEIAAHVRAVLAATTAPIAVYQLPQVVGCEIAPETFATLAQENPRIVLFKDTSGGDAVAASGVPRGAAKFLRGAEGGYAEALATGGYDGWLLSTANGFGHELREIADLTEAGDLGTAKARSDRLTTVVESLFALAGKLGGNAFADANRAVDHIRAHGADAESIPAERLDGSTLPASFVAAARSAMGGAGLSAGAGYLG